MPPLDEPPDDEVGRGEHTVLARISAWALLCARSRSRATCWGVPFSAVSNVPADLKASAIAAGGDFTCALRLDGTIACWGDNSQKQLNAPAGRFRSIAAGGSFACAIHDTGALACWGASGNGQTNAPPGQFAAVGARQLHACALTTQGDAQCWGRELTSIPKLEGRFTDLAVATVGTCGLTASRTISCVAGSDYASTAAAPPGEFSKMTAGAAHVCAIALDGHMTCWGGENGLGEKDVPGGTFTALTTGRQFTCGLRDTGKIACWGNDYAVNVPAPFAE